MKFENFKKIKLPSQPGVYFFMHGKKILYIGKATELKSRTRSYFSSDLIKTRGPMIVDMVFKSDRIKWEETDSVLEALILEANLIKKHQPYYNVREKDDKSWNYVVITRGELPKLLTVRERVLNKFKGAVFGPYTNGTQLKEALRIIRKIFPFIDEASSKRNNQEFYKQIHLTPENLEEYQKNIKWIKLFLQGKKKSVIRNLKKEMMNFAKVKAFEKANEIKRQIFALEHINDVALLKEDSNFFQSLGPSLRSATPSKNHNLPFRVEAYDIAHMGGKNMVGVMTVVAGGAPNKNEYRKFNIRTQSGANDTGALSEVLERRVKHAEWNYPDLIVVDGSTAQINAARGVLGRYGIKTPVVSVVKNERHKPIGIKGDQDLARKYEKSILLANSEAHRFAISFHKLKRSKSFLPPPEGGRGKPK